MAENESLDFGDPNAKRWDVVCDLVRKGVLPELVASKAEAALIGGLRKSLKQFQEKSITLADLLKGRDCPKALRQLLRKTKGHDYCRLFADAAAVCGPTETDCVAGWIEAVLDKVMDQIRLRVAGSEHHSTMDDVQAFTGEVRGQLNPAVERIITKLVEDPNWQPRRAPTRGRVPVDATAELMSLSLLGTPSR